MPAGFHFPDPEDELWVPLALTPEELSDHGRHNLEVVARLQDGIEHRQAQAEMNTIAEALTARYPATNTGTAVNIVPLREQVVGDVRLPLLTLLAATGLVLLIVCANVANLLLGRGTARQRELAIRMALGAGRARVFRQLLTESILLALIGGVLALALAYAGVKALRFVSPPDLPRVEEIGINAWVAAFSLAISLLTAVIFGIAPALHASRQDPQSLLTDGGRGSSPGSRVAMRNLLVTAEIALGVIVLAGAGLLLRSFVRLSEVRLGFQARDVLTQRVTLRGPKYATASQRTTFYRQEIQHIEALSGVRSAAAVSALPLINSRNRSGFTIEGSAPPGPGQLPFAVSRTVTPGYFQTMQIGLLKGRDFSWQDLPDGDRVIIINQAMAGAYWSNADALGRRIKLGPLNAPLPWLTVIGVVDDVLEFDQITQPPPTMYVPVSQSASGAQDLVVRTSQDPLSLAPAVRSAIWGTDKDLPVSLVRTMEAVRGGAVSAQRFNVLLMGLFASLALALAMTGVYGVTAYSVGQRTREIGVRIALGARPAAVLRLVLAQSVKAIGGGVIIGLGAALVLTPFLRNLLFGVRPADPATFAIISLLLAGVAMLACYIPARRATRSDPSVALRYD
jgi:putative ABC transport system permease protein